ncbi:MAG: hypothetical protein GY730_06495 [bacterium]|nr:hypothetical protein [bacterium]
MIIKEAENLLKKIVLKKKNLILFFSVIIALICFVFYSVAVLFLGSYIGKKITDEHKTLILSSFKTPVNYLKGLKADPERIIIDIKYKHFQKLAYKREMALNKGILISDPDDYVPGRVKYKDKELRVKLRLKGDWVDHLKGNKWSFRVKVKGNDTLFGMKIFSIHQPGTRNYLYEWVYNRLLKREGLLSIRYKFINVTLNGKDLGLYALEEHFDKRLIENNKLREGPILKFSEDLLWKERIENYQAEIDPYLRSNIDLFQTSRTMKDPVLKGLLIKAVTLLEKFRNGELKAGDVFDVDKMARYLALTDLMGAHHALFWHNQRFYYNPITSKLEPAGFDGQPGFYIKYPVFGIESKFFSTLFEDNKLMTRYIQELTRVSSPEYIQRFFEEIKFDFDKNLSMIYKEYPWRVFNKSIIYKNQDTIRKALNPITAVYAYLDHSGKNTIDISFGNLQQIPVEVLNIVDAEGNVLARPEKNIIIDKRTVSKPVVYSAHRFALLKGIKSQDLLNKQLKFSYRLTGRSMLKVSNVFSWPYQQKNFKKRDIIRKSTDIFKCKFLVIDKKTKSIYFKSGKSVLNKPLIIPEGYRLYAHKGTHIDLLNNAAIISYSPFFFIGTEERPIVISSNDSSGQGLVLLNAGEKSIFQNVYFTGLSNPGSNGWELTGAVTFYESPVSIKNCSFSNNKSEDALNIVRSKFSIEKTVFSETESDALDIDFGQGEISQSFFLNSGNDGIDVSGAEVKLIDIYINRAGDKGISAGENSMVEGNNIKISNSNIAVAGKDNSKINFRSIDLSDNRAGIAVYQKKSEFGAAEVIVSGRIKKTDTKYIIEKDSILNLNGKVITGKASNVYQQLYHSKIEKQRL